MKFIILLILLYILYLLVKRFLADYFGLSGPRSGNSRPKPPITDELVKDPVCGTYVPKMEALTYGYRGKLYYFCCKECLDRFRKEIKEGKR
jgi:YHS domain-containing protein